jgi:hypothetical protein
MPLSIPTSGTGTKSIVNPLKSESQRGWYMSGLLKSCPCTQAQLQSEALQQWIPRLRESPSLHRKLWEWCYICQALSERDMLRPGRRGLGFAVGREPLTPDFPDGSIVSAWRLRHFPEKPSVSDDFLPK